MFPEQLKMSMVLGGGFQGDIADTLVTTKEKEKEKFTPFSDHNGSLLRQQPGALVTTTLWSVAMIGDEHKNLSCSSVLASVEHATACTA